MIIDPSLFRLPFTSAVKMQKKLKVAIIIGAGEENELALGAPMCGIKATSYGTKLTPKCSKKEKFVKVIAALKAQIVRIVLNVSVNES